MLPDTSITPTLPGSRGRGRSAINQGLLPGLVGFNLRRAHNAVSQAFQAAMARFDITPGQFGVLYLILQNTGLSQSELGNALGIDRSTMVAVIDRLEKRGLVVRAPSPSDRRSYALRLSDSGEALVNDMLPCVQQHDATLASGLTEDEQRTLVSLLQRVSAQAE